MAGRTNPPPRPSTRRKGGLRENLCLEPTPQRARYTVSFVDWGAVANRAFLDDPAGVHPLAVKKIAAWLNQCRWILHLAANRVFGSL